MFEKIVECDTEKDTRQLACSLGELAEAGVVVALLGDLGAGKTVFAKGLARGLGVKEHRYVCSPTFTLINEYEGRVPLYHVDLYRLKDPDELFALGIEEYLYGDGVCAVEWFDRFREDWPPHTLEVRIEFVEGGGRRLNVRARQPEAAALGRRWVEAVVSRRTPL